MPSISSRIFCQIVVQGAMQQCEGTGALYVKYMTIFEATNTPPKLGTANNLSGALSGPDFFTELTLVSSLENERALTIFRKQPHFIRRPTHGHILVKGC